MPPTVDPSTLSVPSPAPSSSAEDSAPPRKRPRSEMSSEERKEARAHRNRIAAQNSRDRRKAQFSFLERRVNELEEENRQLRISIGLLSQGQPAQIPLPVQLSVPVAEDLVRDRENAELKERIRTLERGWDAVVKALAAQGLPTGLAPVSSTPAPAPTTLPPPMAAFPSPAPSHSTLDTDIELASPSTSTPTFVPTSSTSPSPSPRILSVTDLSGPAAGDLASSLNLVDSLATGNPTSSSCSTDDEQAMEELFRDILVPVPSSGEAVNVEDGVGNEQQQQFKEEAGLPQDKIPIEVGNSKAEKMDVFSSDDVSTESSNVDWANEIEMQRLLDSLQQSSSAVHQQAFAAQDFSSDVDLGLGLISWNEVEGMTANGVDVF
ncbi:X-box-binding protein 1 [Leucoagaricus sp. SymC.cos]|nr:X-box-binding protein 1 [Leucoagaricus sp. SymC.cos]